MAHNTQDTQNIAQLITIMLITIMPYILLLVGLIHTPVLTIMLIIAYVVYKAIKINNVTKLR